MNNLVLRLASGILFPVLLLLSIIVLYRGHNLPGGGFIGGLLAASAFLLYGLGQGMAEAKSKLRVDPVHLMSWGVAVALLSGVPSIFSAEPFMTGAWLPGFALPLLGKVHLGTPLVFDVGVFMTVIGFVLHSTFSLAELGNTEEDNF